MFIDINQTISDLDSSPQNGNHENNGTCFIVPGADLNSSLCLGIFCALVTIGLAGFGVNIAVLQASRFASAGQNSTLIFIRSLCTGDMIIGMFGVLKGLHLAFGVDQKINMFLSESLFFTASTAISSCNAWLAIEMFMKLAKPLDTKLMLEKNNVIALMILLWNCAFILGFLPQLGWNAAEYVQEFFQFYDMRYLLFMAIVWELCYFSVFVAQILTWRVIRKIQQRETIMSLDTVEFKRCYNLVVTSRVNLSLWSAVYIPAFIYVGLVCSTCPFGSGPGRSENYMLWVYVAFLTKSLLNGIVHGYRTPQIRAAFTKLLSSVYNGICHPSGLLKARSGQATLNPIDRNSQASGLSILTLTSILQSLDGSTVTNSQESLTNSRESVTNDDFNRIQVTPL